MADVQISANDIQRLADRLTALEPALDDNERIVLRTIFALAAEAIGRSHADIRVRRRPRRVKVQEERTSPESISELFASTFTPTLAGLEADPDDLGTVTVILKIDR